MSKTKLTIIGRIVWITVTLVGGLIIGLLWCLAHLYYQQPSYKGRTVEQWLRNYHELEPGDRGNALLEARREDTIDAMKAIGTNALPIFAKWAVANNDFFQRSFGNAMNKLPIFGAHFPSTAEQREMAFEGLSILGYDALPLLRNLITNADREVRFRSLRCLVWGNPPNKSIAPLLITASNDSDAAVRACAIMSLAVSYPEEAKKIPEFDAKLGSAQTTAVSSAISKQSPLQSSTN